MKILLLLLLPFFVFSESLEYKIHSSAQTVCYLKNPNNGLQATDYNPTISGQTLRNSTEHTVSEGTGCQDWALNPYTNIDTEVYKVVAEMNCAETCSTENEVTTCIEKIDTYLLDVTCNAICEIPRKSDGTAFEKVANVNETDCTQSNIQSMLDSYYPNTDYVADETSYLTCTENVNFQGCYITYHINFDGNNENNNTDNNETNNTEQNNTVDMTETNNKLDGVNNSVNNMNTQLGAKIDANGVKIDALGAKIDANGVKIDNLGIKIDGVSNAVSGVHGAVNGVNNSVNDMNSNLGNKIDGVNQGLSDINDKLGTNIGKEANMDVEIELDGISELEAGFEGGYGQNQGESSSFLGGMISKYVKFHSYSLGLPSSGGCSCGLDDIHIVKSTPVGTLDIDFSSIGMCSYLDIILSVFKYAVMLFVYISGLKYIREIF